MALVMGNWIHKGANIGTLRAKSVGFGSFPTNTREYAVVPAERNSIRSLSMMPRLHACCVLPTLT